MASTLSYGNHSLPHIAIPPPTARRSRLRHAVPTGAFSKHMDSSEAFPSEHTSICNAILVSFEADEDDGKFCQGEQYVVKQVSNAILSANASNPQSQALALGAKCDLTNVSRPNNPPTKTYSYDDLDIPRERPRFNATLTRQNSRSASSEGFQPTSWLNEVPSPVEPRLPVFPPPVRSPTPPGLPSFGSLEAMSYVSPRRSRKGRKRDERSRCGVKRRGTRDDDNENYLFASFFTGLGRILGLIPASDARSERLPPGIVARAEDGTYIRARFGHRQSGHGVGAGPASVGLASHPFHRPSLPTATTASRTRTSGVYHRQPVYRCPPYRSLLDVPPARPNPHKESNQIRSSPGLAPSRNPAVHSADSRRGHFEPHLSNIRENTRSPPRAPPGGYSAPVNMGFSMDGRGDEPNPPNGNDPPLSPNSRGEERLVDGESESDEIYCCSCSFAKNISSFFTKATRACRPEKEHAGKRNLRGHIDAPGNDPTRGHSTTQNCRRNSRHVPSNTPVTQADDDYEYDADANTNTETETDRSGTIRTNTPTSNTQSNHSGSPSSQPTGRRRSSARSSPFVPTGWPASLIYRYSTSRD